MINRLFMYDIKMGNIIKTIGKLYRSIIPEVIRKKIYFPKMFLFEHKEYKNYKDMHQHKERWGEENQDKIFFVIRKEAKAMGLLSCYLTALGKLEEIKEKRYIPIMDMQTCYYPLIHDTPEEKGEKNAWEYYFKSFSEYSINDISQSRNIIVSDKFTGESAMCFFDNTHITSELIQKWIPYDQKYFVLQDDLKKRFDQTYNNLIKGKRVIGIIIREGYIVLSHDKKEILNVDISNHPCQPEFEKMCEILKEKLREWKCDYIYISAEITFTIDYFKKVFGEKIIYTNRDRKIVDNLSVDTIQDAAKKYNVSHSRVEINIDYLEEVYLLSRCTSLLAGKCSASVVAALWNRMKYENLEIIQNGLYKKNQA